jgi:hypothetical protein
MKQSTKNNANNETYFVVLEMLSRADKCGNGIEFTSLNHYDLMVMIDGGVKFADFKNALDEWLESSPSASSKLSAWATIREAALLSSATRLNMLEEED